MLSRVKTTSEVDVAVRMECELGEGPRWDPNGHRLLFVDVLAGHLHAASPDGGLVLTRQVGQALGAVNRSEDGGLVLAMRDGIYLADADGAGLSLFASVEGDRPDLRMNDAACDPAGRLWAGTMAFDAMSAAGTLYRIDADGTVTSVLTGLDISNGLGWSPDAGQMYFIDSPTHRIDVLDFDFDSGTVKNRRPFTPIADTPGVPDGLTIDADGGIWVALWGGAQVRRYSPDGRVTDIVNLPVEQPTSCTFGGDAGDVLYITTARLGLTDAQLAASPLAGSVFACRPGYRGHPAHAFSSR
jgi:sugar lactone lactonase YvrE